MAADFIPPTEQGYDPETGKQVKNADITELFAWISLDPADGSEGILAFHTADYALPMIGADRARIESFRGYVQQMQLLTPYVIEMRRFSSMEVLERLTP